MKANRVIEWTMQNGQKAVCKIEISRKVVDNIAYADGANVTLGKRTSEEIGIIITVDGKVAMTATEAPDVLTKEHYSVTYDSLVAQGAYARLGNAYVNKESYELIMDAIAEINAEFTANKVEAAEYEKVKAVEKAKAEKTNIDPEINHGPGWCNKCQSYCYGDC